MHIKASSLDDLLYPVFKRALASKVHTVSSKGPARELIAVLLTLENPRARFSRTERRATLFSCLGETLWYISGSNKLKVIEHYIPRYREFTDLSRRATVAPGAYGPRIFGGKGESQLDAVINHLRKKDTRQAVVQIFGADDLGKKDVPCTLTLQFMARSGRLHMLTNMRSNDAYRGLPHDVFAFTFMQEIVARALSLELGHYHHAVGSLHLYDDDERAARQYLDEGWQETMAMPPMPARNPRSSVRWLLKAEAAIRSGANPPKLDAIHPYWADLARLLYIKLLLDASNMREIVRQKRAMSCAVYHAFIRGRERQVITDEAQLSLPEIDAN